MSTSFAFNGKKLPNNDKITTINGVVNAILVNNGFKKFFTGFLSNVGKICQLFLIKKYFSGYFQFFYLTPMNLVHTRIV